MKTTFFFLTWLILLGIIKRLFPDWFKNTKPEEDRKVIKPENPPIKVPKEEKVLTKPTTTQSSSIPLNPQGYDYDNTPIKKQKKAKKEKHKREFFTENMPDDFYSLNKLILTPVFSVANLKKPEDFVLEFSVKGLNVYGKEIPTGEIIWETSGAGQWEVHGCQRR